MILDIVDRLISLIEPIANLAKDKRELKDNALRAILMALQETKIYYKKLENGSCRDLEIEAQLVRYWGAAAIPLRHIDEELAILCERKSEYWLNPEYYSDQQIKDLGIKLIDITQAYRHISVPNFHTTFNK
jgi:hypothetical protein